MRRTVALALALAATSCGTDATAPVAPEAQFDVLGHAPDVHGQLLTARDRFLFAVTDGAGTITRVPMARGAGTEELPVLEACAAENGDGRFVRLVVGGEMGYTHELWIRQARLERGMAFFLGEMPMRPPAPGGIDPCDPGYVTYFGWPRVRGGVRIGS